MKPRILKTVSALFVTITFGASLAMGVGQNGSNRANVSGWKTYHDELNSFEVKYPPDWHVSSSTGSGPKLITISKPGDPKARITVAVQKDQNPGKLSIEDWFADQLKKMNAKPESQGSRKVGNQPAMFMDNTNSFGKRRSVFTSLHTTDVLTVIYEPGNQHEPVFEEILRTFQAR